MPRPVKSAARGATKTIGGEEEKERVEETLLFIGSQIVLIDLATFKFHYRQLLVNKLTMAVFAYKVSEASHHLWQVE